MWVKHFLAGALVLSFITCSKSPDSNPPIVPPVVDDTTFLNPIKSSGPDPWVVYKDGYYYYTQTTGINVTLWKTQDITDLKNAPSKIVWNAVPGTAYSDDVWAPEIHYINSKWYIYFTADSNRMDETHRIYVLENPSPDPTTGTWQLKGKVADPSNEWAIDASEFEYEGEMYMIWSGWESNSGGQQNIYIAKLSDPWTIEGNRVLISSPSNSWELNGAPVNEGPEALENNDKLFLTFSGSGCWTDDYCLGLLTLKDGGDPLNAADWSKTPTPVFTKNPSGYAYGPGHNGFFKSPDSTEDWIIYHANSSPGQGCGDTRNPRTQQFIWNTDGTPNFGQPISINQRLMKPSGE